MHGRQANGKLVNVVSFLGRRALDLDWYGAGWFSLNVPSGLTIYWFINNVLSTAQQVHLPHYLPCRGLLVLSRVRSL